MRELTEYIDNKEISIRMGFENESLGYWKRNFFNNLILFNSYGIPDDSFSLYFYH